MAYHRTSHLVRSDDLYRPQRAAHRYIESQRDQAKNRREIGSRLLEAAEVGAGAASVGTLSGMLGTWDLPNTGVPIGLALGVAGHLLDYFDVFGGTHAANFGNGALAAWAAQLGAGWGSQVRAAQSRTQIQGRMLGVGCCDGAPPPRQLGAGPVYSSRPTPMTEAEIVAMSSGIR